MESTGGSRRVDKIEPLMGLATTERNFTTRGLASIPSTNERMDGFPKVFGKYVLLEKLAVGGMAELFSAVHAGVNGFEKQLVIKRILPGHNHDRAFVRMLLHEARIAATLSHPNIIEIFDVGSVEGRYYIAMEHLEGHDLRSIRHWMARTGQLRMPVEHATTIVLGMLAGLAYAHGKRDVGGQPLQIVHRDVSPQNVFVTRTGNVKLLDFGISKSSAAMHNTRAGVLRGSLSYMSPEQVRGEPLDARSDIFSAGVVLYELTTGIRLFSGNTEYETLKNVCDRRIPRPTGILQSYPAELESTVMRALARDRDSRFQSAREFADALKGYVRSHGIASSPEALASYLHTLEGAPAAQPFPQRPRNIEPPSFSRGARDTRTAFIRKRSRRTPWLALALLALLTGVALAAVRVWPSLADHRAPQDQGQAPGNSSIGMLPANQEEAHSKGTQGGSEEPKFTRGTPLQNDANAQVSDPMPAARDALSETRKAHPLLSERRSEKGATGSRLVPLSSESELPSNRVNLGFRNGCRVRIDGNDVGRSPLVRVGLPSGNHIVSCSSDDGSYSHTARVHIPAGSTVVYTFESDDGGQESPTPSRGKLRAMASRTSP